MTVIGVTLCSQVDSIILSNISDLNNDYNFRLGFFRCHFRYYIHFLNYMNKIMNEKSVDRLAPTVYMSTNSWRISCKQICFPVDI